MQNLALKVYFSTHTKLCPTRPYFPFLQSAVEAMKQDSKIEPSTTKRSRIASFGRISKDKDKQLRRDSSLNSLKQRHLVVLVNGLFGSRANWRVISGLLAAHLDPEEALVHVSCVNEFTSTYHGIDTCGERLAQEIRDLVEIKHPTVRRISVIGHSMGGLIARYALGVLFDHRTGLVAGCQPSHFMALVTPHLGCQSTHGPAQVPLISWSSRLPGLQRVTSSIAIPVSSGLFGRSGQQFFLRDRDGASPPLLYRLAHDCPEEGRYYWSALAAFESRTVYANRSGDHLVGWANASLRYPDELADELHSENFKQRNHQKRHKQYWWSWRGGRGVVYEDPLEFAFGQNWEDSDDKNKKGSLATLQSMPCTDKAHEEYINASLGSLRRLPWRRVDVCFAAGFLPMLAHQHIQAQRPWINFVGKATATHVARQMAAMESAVVDRRRGTADASQQTQMQAVN